MNVRKIMKSLHKDMITNITALSKKAYPDIQAIYLFGSYADKTHHIKSDIDIALLLPVLQAKQEGSLAMNKLRFELEELLHRTVDLINLRQVSTVLQKEVTTKGKRILTCDQYASEEFEMLTLSFYQKLNDFLDFTDCILRYGEHKKN